ncbi:MAG: hypothetical protein F4X92_01980 [Gammaproteobacteria bacterium]|nr:hypothetical protein [Gammaproteobacteria bacterium]
MVNVRLTEYMKTRLEALGKIRDRKPHYLMKIATDRFLDTERKAGNRTPAGFETLKKFGITGEAENHDGIVAWSNRLNTKSPASAFGGSSSLACRSTPGFGASGAFIAVHSANTANRAVHKIVQPAGALADFPEKGCPWDLDSNFREYSSRSGRMSILSAIEFMVAMSSSCVYLTLWRVDEQSPDLQAYRVLHV